MLRPSVPCLVEPLMVCPFPRRPESAEPDVVARDEGSQRAQHRDPVLLVDLVGLVNQAAKLGRLEDGPGPALKDGQQCGGHPSQTFAHAAKLLTNPWLVTSGI